MSHTIRSSREIALISVCDPTERRGLEKVSKQGREKKGARDQKKNANLNAQVHPKVPRMLPARRCRTNGFDSDHYRYKPLSQRTIRLIVIHPSRGSDQPLSCHLNIVHFDSAPSYEALSYRWDKQDGGVLWCCGKPLKIRLNLMNALNRLRLPDAQRLIWADAVCINQSDRGEITDQMKIMGEIYNKATRVLVWLGEDTTDEAELALDRIRSISNGIPPPGNLSWWGPVEAFYSLDWFSRLWVFQEIAMATSAEMLWGAASISWETVGLASTSIRTLHCGKMARNPESGMLHAYLFHKWSINRNDSRRESFLYILQVTRKLNCEKPKDRIYALLGFHTVDIDATDKDCFLQPNTKCRTLSVYRKVARHALKRTQTLDVLSAVQHQSSVRRPTWVPRWNISTGYTLAPLGSKVQKFTASECLPAHSIKWKGRWGGVLRVSGIEFDIIVEVADVIPGLERPGEQTAALVEVIAKMRSKTIPYPTGEPLEKVGCWTLTAGKDWYGMIDSG
ncbi:uncharacterized protein BDZ99DRAFT_118757 [Mytilinidion resinicola]|uniref:Heterokaryon incompatibility domain-containing protein n=1 Tax=Mytilinidion resinicola TaxID=574789 RepID=A0A6A6Z5L4_9PEZI|nr:uncharacterized protein BDZ99DRAFT_118757 [Mytilinidion resinicola]KAF2815584.1 hypothetical protein BDZ99DRAFT_118757 [Mytilinidion resinicola]